MRENNTIPEIRAEMLLNYLYPEGEKQWIARNEGAFYRNYNNDLLSFENDTKEVMMARDGFLNLLPQGMLTMGDEMKGEDLTEKYKQAQRRLKMLKEAFLPFDTFFFRQEVSLERMVSELLRDKLTHILHTYFDFDYEAVESPLVKEAAAVLPYVSQKRGDFGFIGSLLRTLIQCEVNTIVSRYSHTDTTRHWIPRVRYELLIPGLTSDEFKEKDAELEPLRQFICEWFIPVEVKCEILIKEHQWTQQADKRLALGYNTELGI